MEIDVYQFSMHAKFARKEVGVVDRANRPDSGSDKFIDIGLIEEFEHDFSKGQDLEIWRPSPGHLELHDIREIKNSFMFKFTSGEFGPLAMEIFYRTSEQLDSSSTVFTPGSAQLRQGWLHADFYNADTDDLAYTMDVFGRIKITGGIKSQETSILKPTWEFIKLYSALNTGAIEV